MRYAREAERAIAHATADANLEWHARALTSMADVYQAMGEEATC